jgi:hypothetical protein
VPQRGVERIDLGCNGNNDGRIVLAKVKDKV